MRPVSTGTQKISMNSAEADYEAKRRAAEAQADGNPFVAGIQEVITDGASEAVKESRSNYGVATITKADVMEGKNSNFSQPGDAANNPNANPEKTTGSLANQASATTVPQEDPETFQADALEERLAMYAGKMPPNQTLNDRTETMRG